MVYLLINKNKGAKYLPCSEQYRIFTDPAKAIQAVLDLGWSDPLGLGIKFNLTEPGIMNTLMYGDINLSLMAVSEE